MRAALLLPLIGASLAAPLPPSKRDLMALQGAFVSIQAAASTMDSMIKGLPATAAGFKTAAAGVESALAQAKVSVAPTQPIGLGDSLPLQQTAESLASTVKIAIMDMVLMRSVMDSAGVTGLAVQTLNNQKMLAGALGGVVLSKLPAEGLPGAQMAFGGTAGALDVGLGMLSMPPSAMAGMMMGGGAAPAAAAGAAPAAATGGTAASNSTTPATIARRLKKRNLV
ncbi:hypothetical protein GQ53DRAFT_884522 [Thozetella sp. PMI_491]|nr:hypothetical protein GQ53DRAFT_884522 [Thozetella sp. PMI_491]